MSLGLSPHCRPQRHTSLPGPEAALQLTRFFSRSLESNNLGEKDFFVRVCMFKPNRPHKPSLKGDFSSSKGRAFVSIRHRRVGAPRRQQPPGSSERGRRAGPNSGPHQQRAAGRNPRTKAPPRGTRGPEPSDMEPTGWGSAGRPAG